jgi:hypothetical protein
MEKNGLDIQCTNHKAWGIGKTNIVYEVEIKHKDGSQYCISRTYDEFQNLHKTLKKEMKKDQRKKLPKFPTGMFVNTHDKAAFLSRFFKFLTSEAEFFAHAAVKKFIEPRTKLLHLAVTAGRNIIGKTKKGSNVFCRVAMYDSQKRVGKSVRTAIVKKTLNPVWKEPEPVVYEVNEQSDDQGGVTISCWHRTSFGRNVFLGRINIPFHTIPYNKDISRWFPLHPTHGRKSNVHGEISLNLHFKTNADGRPQDDLTPEERELRREQKEERQRRRLHRETERGVGDIHLQYLYNPPYGAWEGYLTLKVVEGRKIKMLGDKVVDPYVVLSVGANRERTKTKKSTSAPVWNANYFFYIPPEQASSTFDVDLYDWSLLGTSNFVGDASVLLEDLETDFLQDVWWVMCGPPLTQKGISKKLGKQMAEQGYTPNIPIVLVPGFASSGLEVIEGHKPWVGDRVWISLNKIGLQNVKRKFDIGRNKNAYDTLDFGTKNIWIKHLCLHGDDCRSDPAGIKVRAIQGKQAVTYLDPGLLTGSLSYVMGPLVENLESLGYADGVNLMTAPYDWRLPYFYLEERDGYFTWLMNSIEKMAKREKKPVVLLGHSMGNRIIQYFCLWVVKRTGSRRWLDENVHTFVAVGAPFLGSPKCVRGMISGDRFGMDLLLSSREAKAFGRTLGSTPALMPISKRQYDDYGVGVIYAKVDEAKAHQAVPYWKFFPLAGAQKTVEIFTKYYVNDPIYSGGEDDESAWPIVTAPPLNRLYAIYGTNLDTERIYFYRRKEKEREAQWWVLDENPQYDAKDPKLASLKISGGVGFETADTPQPCIERLTGLKGCASGDGTVTYASLNHCASWRKDILELRIDELEGVEHREILNNRLFFKKLIEYICDKPKKIKSPAQLTVRGKKYLKKHGQDDEVDDIAGDHSDEDEDESGSKDDLTLSTSSGASTPASTPVSSPFPGRKGDQPRDNEPDNAPPLHDGSVIIPPRPRGPK